MKQVKGRIFRRRAYLLIKLLIKNEKTIEKYSHLASIEEMRRNKYNLNIPRYTVYCDTYEEEEEIDVTELQQEMQQLQKGLVNIRPQMDTHLKDFEINV
ncbi:N-6 DNA methylase [Rickettsia canadensis]|uniref:N-6 DNA methylase n=1 Tax=Rickettsia canadensis TaxID=788 RepID=UPI000314D119|nr:N-6 DNA methylase [Rickettsia canadensis]